jgi:hypothetical protein
MAPMTPSAWPQPRVLYWDDLAVGTTFDAGPAAIDADQLDRALALSGEHHPIHEATDFASATPMKERVIPGTLVHMVAEALLNAENGVPVRLGPARMHTDYLTPLHPGDPFTVTARVIAMSPTSASCGAITWVRTVRRADGTAVAVARITESVERRGTATAASVGSPE